MLEWIAQLEDKWIAIACLLYAVAASALVGWLLGPRLRR